MAFSEFENIAEVQGIYKISYEEGRAPLVMIVEAKKNDFEQGWGQCRRNSPEE